MLSPVAVERRVRRQVVKRHSVGFPRVKKSLRAAC